MKPSKTTLALAAAGSLALAGGPALAHHSFAMFDNQKTLTLHGTVKDFQFTNPHSWVELVVKDPAGNPVEWAVEGGSPNALVRQGWKRTTLKPGDAAIVVVHPLKDGSAGGSLVSVSVNGVALEAGK